MSKIKTLSRENPVLFSLGITLGFALFHAVFGKVMGLFPESTLELFVEEMLDLIWPVALALALDFGYIFRMKGFGKTMKAGLAVFAFFTLLLLFMFLSVVIEPETRWQGLPVILVGIVSMIGVGIREEVLFRGIIGNALVLKYGRDDKGLWSAVLLSAFLFGIIHFTNIFYGVQLSGLIAQIIGATSLGALFMAIYLRGGNLWVLILTHAIIDGAGLFDSVFVQSAVSKVEKMSALSLNGLFLTIPVQVFLTLFLLRKKKRREIFARLEQLRKELQG